MPADRPSLPAGTARIVNVFKTSSTGDFFQVVVRLDGLLPAQLPDFGSAITSSGVAPKEYLGKYDTYVLTAVRPDETGSNRLLIYEALPGNTETGTVITEQGQVGTRTVQRVAPSTTVTGSATTVKADVTPDGAGVSVKEVITVPDVFDEKVVSAQKDSNIPPEFLANRPAQTVEYVTSGTSVTAPVVLTGDQLSKSERRVTEFKKEIKTVERDEDALPSLEGQEYDEGLNEVISYTWDVVPAGTTASASEITPRSDTKSVKKTYDLDAIHNILDGKYYKFPVMENVSLPDTLTDVEAVVDSSSSMEKGGSYGSSLSRSTGISVSIAGDLVLYIKQGYSGPVPGVLHLFYLPEGDITQTQVLTKINSGGGSAEAWPAVFPMQHTLVVTGGSKGVTKSASFSTKGVSSSASTSTAVSTKSITIPPTLHDEIEIVDPDGPDGPNTIDTQLVITGVPTTIQREVQSSSWEWVEGSVGPPVVAGQWKWVEGAPELQEFPNPDYLGAEVLAKVFPGVLEATNPTSFPSGVYLKDVSVSQFKFGYVKVAAVTVNLAGYV